MPYRGHMRLRKHKTIPRGAVIVLCFLLPLSLMACAGEDIVRAPEGVERIALRTAVSSELLGQLGSDGRFRAPDATSVHRSSVITAERARILATAFAREFLPFAREHHESQRGATIAFDQLSADDHTLLAEPRYEEAPEAVPLPTRKHHGGYYLVRLRDGVAEHVMTVAVSALATDIVIVNGRPTPTAAYGNEFRVWIVPVSGRGEPAMGPEEAAVRVHQRFGARAVAVPRLIRVGTEFFPHLSHWLVALDHEIAVRTGPQGGTRGVRAIMLGSDGRFSVPSESAGSAGRQVTFLNSGGQRDSARVPLRSGLAAGMTEVLDR